jgi:putative Holliday junction resolvase
MIPFHTLLGVDFGLKKIGLAIGQTVTQTASPIGILKARNGTASANDLKKIINTWRPEAIVIGIPLNMNDSPSPIAAPAEAFAQWLETETQLPVFRADERLTTKAARYELADLSRITHSRHSTAPVDAYAAVLILEAWLHDLKSVELVADDLAGDFQ